MIEIDPAVAGGWQPGGARNALRLDVDDPAAAWPAVCDVLDEVPAGWSEVLVVPGGLRFCCSGADDDDPGPILAEVTARLHERGVGGGRLAPDDEADPAQPGALLDLAEATSWVAAWLVPLRVPGVSVTYRALREWRVRRFPPGLVRRVAADLVARSGPAVRSARVGWPAGALDLPPAALPDHAPLWLEHGITTASALGDLPPTPGGPGGAVADAGVLVTTVRRGTEMLGVGRAAAGLVDDRGRASLLVEELTELVVGLAGDLAYAVVGVHDTGREPAMGTPFREAVPATARARSRGLSLAALDQWVLDAAPVQLLGPHHRLAAGQGVTEEPVGDGRRLVRIGTPDDWFSGPARRAQVRNRGREALAACLPPPHTPMPAPLL